MEKIIPGEILAQEEIKSSSSNNIYIATIYDNCISCTCPAGGRKTLCKHLISVIHNNLELIKQKNINFYNELITLLETKNDRIHDIEAFKSLSNKLIYSNKDIAQASFKNSAHFKEEPLKKQDITKSIIDDIDNIDIHKQFEFFELLCHAYNSKDIGFRYCEEPKFLNEFVEKGYLVPTEISKDLKSFKKMDKGRKSNYFYKFSPDLTPIIRQLHKNLSIKFPKIKEFDEDGVFFVEKRVIDPKYL